MNKVILNPASNGQFSYSCGTAYDGTIVQTEDRNKILKRALRSGKNVVLVDGELTGTSSKPADNMPKKVNTKDVAQLAFLKTLDQASDNHPDELKMSDVNWKYLVRSVLRGKNIMMTGPAGCGKTFAAQQVAATIGRELHYFNLDATQYPLSTLLCNVAIDNNTRT